MSKRWKLLWVLMTATATMLLGGCALNGCNKPDLSVPKLHSDAAPPMQEHEITIALPQAMPPAPPPRACPEGMVLISDAHWRFCLDKFEAPNIEGQLPYYAMSFSEAEQYCGSQHKRLATEQEWEAACLGPKHHQFFYGNTFHPGWCRDEATNWIKVDWAKMWGPNYQVYAKSLFKGVPSGSYPRCTNEYGLFDMLGNTTEIVKASNRPWGYATKGGYWYQRYGGPEFCTFSNFAHPNRFRQYEAGVRCASSTD